LLFFGLISFVFSPFFAFFVFFYAILLLVKFFMPWEIERNLC
jgi:hypothetical protein